MSRSTARNAVLVLGLITAIIHLVVLNVFLGQVSVPFTLNGLGYLVLLFAFLNPSILPAQRRWIHYALIGFTVVTILGWFLIGDKTAILGILTKIDEVLLIFAVWQHLKYVE